VKNRGRPKTKGVRKHGVITVCDIKTTRNTSSLVSKLSLGMATEVVHVRLALAPSLEASPLVEALSVALVKPTDITE